MTQKTTTFLLALLTTLLCATGAADVLHWPQFCAGGQLLIKNKTSYDLSIWLQKFGSSLISEDEFDLKAGVVSSLPLEALAQDERYSLLNFNGSKDLDIKYKCGGDLLPVNSVEGGDLTFKKSDLPVNKIWLQNLFAGENNFEIEFQSRTFEKISSRTLSLQNTESRTLVIGEGVSGWSYFKVSASNKFSVFNILKAGAEAPLLTAPSLSVVDAKSFYFLVGPRSGISDTFVVKITDSALAEKARDLAFTQKDKMLFARVQKDHQSFNRNWSKPEKSFWSWSTSEVTSFGDLGSTACNGTPQQVEDRVDSWVNDPGQICFWNYRVKKELTAEEVSTGVAKSRAPASAKKKSLERH